MYQRLYAALQRSAGRTLVEDDRPIIRGCGGTERALVPDSDGIDSLGKAGHI